jgi:ATP-dependent DNA ligase
MFRAGRQLAQTNDSRASLARCTPICIARLTANPERLSGGQVPLPPLVLSREHWVEPKLVAEITYLTWTADNLLRHTVYVGLREDKPADQVRREVAAPARS